MGIELLGFFAIGISLLVLFSEGVAIFSLLVKNRGPQRVVQSNPRQIPDTRLTRGEINKEDYDEAEIKNHVS